MMICMTMWCWLKDLFCLGSILWKWWLSIVYQLGTWWCPQWNIMMMVSLLVSGGLTRNRTWRRNCMALSSNTSSLTCLEQQLLSYSDFEDILVIMISAHRTNRWVECIHMFMYMYVFLHHDVGLQDILGKYYIIVVWFSAKYIYWRERFVK